MKKALLGCMCVGLLGVNGFCQKADPNTENLKKIDGIVEQVLQNKALEAQLDYTLFETRRTFFEQLSALQEPNADRISELLNPLAATYNKVRQIDPERALKDAKTLNAKVRTAWLRMGYVNMLDLFDNYLPDAHHNETLAAFELNLRLDLMDQNALQDVPVVMNALAGSFSHSYRAFEKEVKAMTKEDDARVVASLSNLLDAYETVARVNPDMGRRAAKSVFVKPFRAGWGPAVCVKDLVQKYALRSWAGGDGVERVPAEELVQRYGQEKGERLARVADILFPGYTASVR